MVNPVGRFDASCGWSWVGFNTSLACKGSWWRFFEDALLERTIMQKACRWTEAVKSACVPVQVVLTNFELRKHQEIPIVVGVKYYHCYLTITAYNKCYLLATSDARSMR